MAPTRKNKESIRISDYVVIKGHNYKGVEIGKEAF